MAHRSLLDNPQHWRDRAEETRSVADDMVHGETRSRLLKIAEEYEHLAKLAEKRAKENVPK